MAKFAQYAMAATEEALQDANWKPEPFEQREVTVCLYFQNQLNEYLSDVRESVLGLVSATLMKCTALLLHMRKV